MNLIKQMSERIENEISMSLCSNMLQFHIMNNVVVFYFSDIYAFDFYCSQLYPTSLPFIFTNNIIYLFTVLFLFWINYSVVCVSFLCVFPFPFSIFKQNIPLREAHVFCRKDAHTYMYIIIINSNKFNFQSNMLFSIWKVIGRFNETSFKEIYSYKIIKKYFYTNLKNCSVCPKLFR